MERTKYIDKRKWLEYNEKLVRRGELYFSFDFLDSWSNDLALKNEGKIGRRYEFPEPLSTLPLVFNPMDWQVDNFIPPLLEILKKRCKVKAEQALYQVAKLMLWRTRAQTCDYVSFCTRTLSPRATLLYIQRPPILNK
jgi:hypothetical protein